MLAAGVDTGLRHLPRLSSPPHLVLVDGSILAKNNISKQQPANKPNLYEPSFYSQYGLHLALII